MAVDALACAHNRARGVDWPRERRACRLAEGGRLCAAVARPTYSTRFRGAVPPPLDFTRALEHTGVTPPRHRKVVTPYNLCLNFNMLPSTSTTSTTSTPAAAAAPRSVPPPTRHALLLLSVRQSHHCTQSRYWVTQYRGTGTAVLFSNLGITRRRMKMCKSTGPGS